MQSERMIEAMVREWCRNTTIEVVEVLDRDEPTWTGIEFDLSYDNSDDIHQIIEHLEQKLDADIFVGEPNFEYSGERHHCFVMVGKNNR